MDLKPKISFTFPYRWLTEEREFLPQRLLDSARKGGMNNPMHDRLMFGPVLAYVAILKTHAYKPVKATLTKSVIEKALKPMFTVGRCANMESFFVQTYSPSLLPVMELEIYF